MKNYIIKKQKQNIIEIKNSLLKWKVINISKVSSTTTIINLCDIKNETRLILSKYNHYMMEIIEQLRVNKKIFIDKT